MTPDPASLAHLRHELRTPLNHVLGYSEMLLEDAGDASALALELQQVRGEGRALLAVVEESLSPARVEASGPDLGRIAAALSAPLDRLGEAVDRLGRLASEGDSGAVAADAERIAAAVARLRTLVEGWAAGPERGAGPTPVAVGAVGRDGPAGRSGRRSRSCGGAGHDPGRRRRRGEPGAADAAARPGGSQGPGSHGRPRGARPPAERARGSRPPRRHDAGPRRARGAGAAQAGPGAAAHPRPDDLGAQRDGERRALDRAGGRGLPAEAVRPRAAAGPDRSLPREEAPARPRGAARRGAGGVEPHPRAARRGAGGPGRAPRPAEALLLAPARRADRGRRRRRPAPHPPPRDHRRLPGPPRLHRASPRPPSRRR